MSNRPRATSRARKTAVAGIEGLRIAFDSLGANRVRAGLTVLGVAIGVGAVVAMAALITGVRSSVQEGIESAGPRNFFVTRFDFTDVQRMMDGSGRPPWWNRPPITTDEVERVAALPAVGNAVMSLVLQDPGSGGGVSIEYGNTRIQGIQGTAESQEWPDYRMVDFVEGRNFVRVEVEEARTVLVLTQQLATDLFGTGPAVGRRVRVRAGAAGSVPFIVVGVIDTGENIFEGQVAHLAVIPYTTALRKLGVNDERAQMIVVPEPDVPIELAEDQVIGTLRSMRGLSPAEENNFAVLRSTQLLEFFDQFTAVFFIVMLALSSVGLLVGGVGVIGIMLISVTERTREIGVRKALGATRLGVLWQFLVEAAVLTLAGGGVGLAGGGALAWAAASFTPVPAAVPLWAIAASLAMAAVTGMLFGLAPAIRAARMEPVTALRYE